MVLLSAVQMIQMHSNWQKCMPNNGTHAAAALMSEDALV